MSWIRRLGGRAPIGIRPVLSALGFVVLALLARRAIEAPRVDPERSSALMELHRALLPDQPRPLGSDASREARDRIALALDAAGCPTRVDAGWSCDRGQCAFVTNLWCRMGPPSGEAVVGLAHTDSVAAGPGAADDGAGVVAWVDAVRRLREVELQRPFLLVLTDGEELGLHGFRRILDHPPFPDPIGVVVNLEARGTRGASLLFELVGPSARWVAAFARSGVRPNGSSAYVAVYDRMPNATDVTLARDRGLPAVNHAFLGGLPRYHTPLDDRAHLDPRSLAHHADVAFGWVEALQPPDERGGDVMFVDLLGRVLLRFPIGVGVALGIVAGAGWLGWLYADRRSLARVGPAVALGVGSLFGAVALAELAGLGLDAVAGPTWYGRPAPLRVVVWVATLAAALPLGRLDDRVRWHVVSGIVGLLVLILLVADPRLAVLLVPAQAAGVALRTAALRWPEVGVHGLGVALAVVMLPLAWGLDEALTLAHPAVVAGPLWLALAGWPLPKVGGRAVAALFGLGGVALVVGALGPAFTADRPQPINLTYVQQGDVARLYATAWVGALPEGLPERTTLPSLGLPAPAIERLGPGELRIRPTRGGRTIGLEVAGPVTVDGVRAEPWRGGLELVGVSREGVVVRTDGAEPTVVWERTDGLPQRLGELARRRGAGVPIHDGDGAVVRTAP